MEKIYSKRVGMLLASFIVVMLLLASRVLYIQIFCHDELETMATSQYEVLIEGMDTRGMILDRNYMPLTGGTSQYYYFIKKEKGDNELMALTHQMGAKQIANSSSQYYVFRTEAFDENTNDQLKDRYDAYVFKSSARYADDQMACHLIGYLNEDEKVGVSGLELLYQKQLKADDSMLSLWADAGGNIIKGEVPKVYSAEGYGAGNGLGKGVVTTIDRRIQYGLERSLEEGGKTGAGVVMDGDTGEVLAWASSPTFNPNDIASYLAAGNDCLINKVNQGAYPPGSVFKIVTAAAALEKGISPETQIECKGKDTVEGIQLSCASAPDGGHGNIDMYTAMAVSCNCYFAKIGEKIGFEEIIKQAELMGFGKETMENYPEETCGNLPNIESSGVWDTSNISIGQGEILATPIQIAQMTSIIARGGSYVEPSIIIGGNTTVHHVLSEERAKIIEDMMADVMEYGTGAKDWETDVWGKTGTAEAGSEKETQNYCWFTGYCRLDEKTYVITVMIEDGKSGTADALPVFKDMVELISKM